MAEIPILKSTVNLISKDQESWIQNMWTVNDRLEVRPGWGQLAQFDTTLSFTSDNNRFGYEDHLGSVLLETSFGHEQIFSVFSGRAATENFPEGKNANTFANRIFVRIYDITTGRNWEEALVTHTSAMQNIDLFDRQGVYKTSASRDYRSFLDGGSEQFVFTTFGGDLFFGNKFVGMHVYFPADFRHNNIKQVYNSEHTNWIPGYSETCLIAPLKLSPGIDHKTHRYLAPGELGTINAMEIANNRMVYAVGNTLHFSDINFPSSVKAIDFQLISSQRSIVALKRLRDALLVFTDTETFYYAFNNGELASGGRLVRVSDTVGCLSQNAISELDTGIVWVDTSGIYSTSNGLSIDMMSQDIRPFFTESDLVTNPMTSFFESSSGAASPTSNDHPRTLLPFKGKNVSVAYDKNTSALLVSFPELNGMWCFRQGWSWWTLESVVSTDGGSPEVKRVENLKNPWVLSGQSGFYTVLSDYENAVVDLASHRTGVNNELTDQDDDFTSSSYVLCHLNRGGGTDRSSAVVYDAALPRSPAEDLRAFSGKYRSVDTASTGATLYARPPVVLDNGDHLVPFEYVADSSSVVHDLTFNFWYDSSKWKASGWDAGGTDTTIDLLLSPEMAKLSSAVTTKRTVDKNGVATVGVNAVAIQIFIDSSAVATSYTGINLGTSFLNKLFYIRFRPINGYSQGPLNGLGFSKGLAGTGTDIGQKDSGGTLTAASFYAWSPCWAPLTKTTDATNAEQAVDWAFKSSQVSNKGQQLMARGLFADVKSTGSASTKLEPNWLWGVYNVLLGSDFKGWLSQIIDYNDNIDTIQDKLTIRSRMSDSGTMRTKTFNNVAKWSSSGTPSDGNYLIDDEQEDEIATSDTVKGQSLSYMVFGFIRNRAERFGIKRLTAVVRRSGQRRRRIGR